MPFEPANELTTYLYQKGSSIAGIPTRYRLTLRERDAEFFKEYIQSEGGINKLKEVNLGLSQGCLVCLLMALVTYNDSVCRQSCSQECLWHRQD